MTDIELIDGGKIFHISNSERIIDVLRPVREKNGRFHFHLKLSINNLPETPKEKHPDRKSQTSDSKSKSSETISVEDDARRPSHYIIIEIFRMLEEIKIEDDKEKRRELIFYIIKRLKETNFERQAHIRYKNADKLIETYRKLIKKIEKIDTEGRSKHINETIEVIIEFMKKFIKDYRKERITTLSSSRSNSSDDITKKKKLKIVGFSKGVEKFLKKKKLAYQHRLVFGKKTTFRRIIQYITSKWTREENLVHKVQLIDIVSKRSWSLKDESIVFKELKPRRTKGDKYYFYLLIDIKGIEIPDVIKSLDSKDSKDSKDKDSKDKDSSISSISKDEIIVERTLTEIINDITIIIKEVGKGGKKDIVKKKIEEIKKIIIIEIDKEKR